MARPFVVGDETLHLSASGGITHYPKDATDIESLVKHADQAMYVAKQQGRNRYTYFSHVMQERAQSRRQLIKDLRSARSISTIPTDSALVVFCDNIHYQSLENKDHGTH